MMNNSKTLAGPLSASNICMSIEKSHQRSLAYGLTATDKPDFNPLVGSDLSLLVEQNRSLHIHALPVMETLYEQIINTHNMVILTDVNGLIIHTLGDDDFLEKADRVALKPGVIWSEQSKGTNAIGTAIVEQAPTMIHADELRARIEMQQDAVLKGRRKQLIFNHLCRHAYQRHRMLMKTALVASHIENPDYIAVAIENRGGRTCQEMIGPQVMFIGTLMEGIASFAPNGRFLSANRSALFQLGLSLSALHSHTFSSLFGLPVSALFDHYRTAAPDLLNLCLHNGVRVFGRAQLRLTHSAFQHSSNTVQQSGGSAPQPVDNPPSQQACQQNSIAATRRLSGLRYLNTGDPQIATVIEKVTKVLGRDIPILVMGETGTGKELLAQAIHNDSPRSKGPFIAVNCASIPETLIESELFGYEDGAFTGARKKGSIGKILQANGGTLCL